MFHLLKYALADLEGLMQVADMTEEDEYAAPYVETIEEIRAFIKETEAADMVSAYSLLQLAIRHWVKAGKPMGEPSAFGAGDITVTVKRHAP